jgi:alkanesulfonate monooxygenase SsuD/methylene tetrahydromethanopterin reductase-like flavin-dependent oxidoreductase (luciferase family)
MRYSNFLFPESRDPTRDGVVIDEVMREAALTEALGFDTVWLSEHHFDGNCAYVDPMAFGAALAAATSRIRIGYAVAQISLHHPVRLAEQFALIDNISKGRLIVGLGRGTTYNVYEYQGYGIDPAEAKPRFEEAVEIMTQAWTSESGFRHAGRFWTLDVPVMRPRPYTRPHPFTIRAAASDASIAALGASGQPFLMNLQTNEITSARIAAWRQAARQNHVPESAIEAALDQSWIWRNVFIADTDAEAERIGIPAFAAMTEYRAATRNRIQREQGISIAHAAPASHSDPRLGLICGSPATVARQMEAVAATGVGGVILTFRLGPLSYADTARSLRLFAEEVVPRVGTVKIAA